MKELFIVTGATGGMGYAMAKSLMGKGQLLLLDISLEKLKKVQNEFGKEVDVLKFDITNPDDIKDVVDYVRDYGGFNYLLHFAGVSESMGNSELIYKINLVGTKLLLDSLYEHVLPQGVVITTSSMTGHMNLPSKEVKVLLRDPLKNDFLKEILPFTKTPNLAYGWSKFGVIELTKAEGAKWGQKDARIISISPGAIKTPMVEVEMEKNSEQINNLIAATPMKRIGKTSDIVNLVDFLISDKASFITGTDILIDGGVTEIFKAYLK